MNLINVERDKMWQNIPDALCFQLSIFYIRPIGLIKLSVNNVNILEFVSLI